MYYTIQDGQILTADNIEVLTEYYGNIQELPLDYEVGKYIVVNDELVLNPNYEQEQAQKERERIAQLFLTGADVERGIFKARGADFEDIINMIGQMQINSDPRTEGIELKALKIELKANNFYRGNPYVEAIGTLLGFTSEQLDKFFEDGNYEHLLVKEVFNLE